MLPHLFAMHDDPVRQVVDLVFFREFELVRIQFMNRNDPARVRGLLQPGENNL